MYPAKYTCMLHYIIMMRLYPVEQWILLMWHDYNPYIEYRHCNFCNEMFTPGENVHCNQKCSQSKNNNSHYFHIVC